MAEKVVAGESIEHAEIKSLRKLIEAVQAHPNAKLAPPREARDKQWKPPEEDSPDALTKLKIVGGRVLDGDYQALDVRVTLACSASFAGDAGFGGASFAGDARFGEASFAGDAWFDGASFAGAAGFEGASFAEQADFDGMRFAGDVYGDFRTFVLRTAKFAESATDASRARRLARWAFSRPWRKFGWTTVRGLGLLSILNRVSLIALIAIPVIAACWPAVRAAAGAYHRYAAESQSAMERVLDETRRIADHPNTALLPEDLRRDIDAAVKKAEDASTRWREHIDKNDQEPKLLLLPETLAYLFFASVLVSLGLLLYQVFADEDIRKFDEDGFIDRAHQRYPEEAKDRDDGLRRAIEHLERIAEKRPDRRRSFVSHHGDTIWVPPRDRIDWFNDPEPSPEDSPSPADSSADATAPKHHTDPARIEEKTPAPKRSPEPTVRGAERRRIVIEEGARAEYWLKSRENLAAAVLSFLLYMIGIGFLLGILVIQLRHVASAAGWTSWSAFLSSLTS